MTKFRKMTMGEVAEIAGDPKETIRTRINRGVSVMQKTPGWARFDIPSTMQIAVHAQLTRIVGIDEIAMLAATYTADCVFDYLKKPPFQIKRIGQIEGCHLIFRRNEFGSWEMKPYLTQDKALFAVGEHLSDTQFPSVAGFYFLNISTLFDWALDRIFDLQGIDVDVAGISQ